MNRIIRISTVFLVALALLAGAAGNGRADTVDSALFVLNTQYLSPVGGAELPATHRLGACAPNPFNPATTIGFSLANRAQVELIVYDLTGRRVRTLLAGRWVEAGDHEAKWRGIDEQGREVAAGVYLARFRAGEITATRRMTLIK